MENTGDEVVITIDAPHFNAGFVIDRRFNIVTKAAPIIRYMEGWSWQSISRYCRRKGWQLVYQPEETKT